MKIAILSFYSGLVDRGVETWARSFKEKLGNRQQVEIFGGEKYGRSIDWQNKHWSYWRFLLLKHALHTLGKWSKCDIIIPTNGTIQTVISRIVTWVMGKPMIVFGHSGPGADDKWNLLCSPNVFVAFSQTQGKWANKFKLPWTRVVVILHAIDLHVFTPAPKKPNKKIVLCVAANSPSKRVNLVESAVKLIPGATFMAVGKGNTVEKSFDQMPDVYKEADVFCFVPQPWEAFGLVFLEALATNLPVVTIDDPVRREIVGDAGYFVKNPEDSDSLAQAIKKALAAKWGDKPRRQAQKYSWDEAIKGYNRLFEDLA